MWEIWEYRDLSPGDTASYFVHASRWADGLQLEPAFYPLYTIFYGSQQWIFSGAYGLTVTHRILAAIVVALLVLAVLRRLLSPGIAWALAVWWAVNPIYFDTLYEVHLFAMAPALGTVLIALTLRGLTMRSLVFGALLASALLVRSEYIVAAALWLLAWLAYEIWQWRKGAAPPVKALAVALAAPIVVMSLLTAIVIERDYGQSSGLQSFSEKHELNVCQTYAQGRWQSGDMLVSNPHAECAVYMQRDFDAVRLSLREAISENPSAMFRHFSTNVALIPSGLQVDLFNEMSGGSSWADNPDYVPVRAESLFALVGSVVVLGILIVGLVLLWRERRHWWMEWLSERAWGWLALIVLALAGLYAAVLTRPRPQYMFTASFLLMAVIGLCILVIAARWPSLTRFRVAIPVVALLLMFLPSRYTDGYENPQTGPGQGLKAAVERTEPFRQVIRESEGALLATYPDVAICEYVGGDDPCLGLPWGVPHASTLREAASRGIVDPLSGTRSGIELVYANEDLLSAPEVRAVLTQLEAAGWERLGPPSPEEDWVLLRRPSP